MGSNNPDGIEIKKSKDPWGHPVDGIPFHPYYTVKDLVGVGVFMLFFATVIFYMPEMGGYFLEHANFIPADPMKTPEHIAPVWYFTPFYAILRAIPDKFAGVIGMGGAIVVLFLLPWLDRSPVKSIRYRGGIYQKGVITVCNQLPGAWLFGYATCNADSNNLCSHFNRDLLWLLPVNAPLYSLGKIQTSARTINKRAQP